MSRTKTTIKSDVVEFVATDETMVESNTALVVPEFHIPTPAEIRQLTDEEVSEANAIARKVIDSIVNNLKCNFDNNIGIRSAVYLGESKTSSKVIDYTLRKIKECMLESGWYVEITKRNVHQPEDTIYDYRIMDNNVLLEQAAAPKAKATRKIKIWSAVVIATVFLLSIATVSLFVS